MPFLGGPKVFSMNNHQFDTFISYASEDEAYSSALATELQNAGFTVWFAPLNLNIGDRLLDSINVGLTLSRTGIVLLSSAYIKKRWTSYELDVLHRQHIETEKRLFPLWHDIGKSELDGWNPGLSGILSIPTSYGLEFVILKLAARIAEGAPLRGVAPVWENAFHRFLRAQGELNVNHVNGPTFNIFEAVLIEDSRYPIFIDGTKYSKADIAYHAAIALAHGSYHPHMKPIAKELEQITKVCISLGYDPKKMA